MSISRWIASARSDRAHTRLAIAARYNRSRKTKFLKCLLVCPALLFITRLSAYLLEKILIFIAQGVYVVLFFVQRNCLIIARKSTIWASTSRCNVCWAFRKLPTSGRFLSRGAEMPCKVVRGLIQLMARFWIAFHNHETRQVPPSSSSFGARFVNSAFHSA